MRTYNCARVHIGDYSYGHIAFMPQDDTYHSAKCGYSVLDGDITTKKLKPIRLRGADDEGDFIYHILDTYVIYPKSDKAVIKVFSRKGRYNIQLIKAERNTRSNMYKMRL